MAIRLVDPTLIPKSAEMEVKHPATGEPIGLTLVVNPINRVAEAAVELSVSCKNDFAYARELHAAMVSDMRGQAIEGDVTAETIREFMINPDHLFILDQLVVFARELNEEYSAKKK
jgi:hypothetical protein